MTPLMIRFGAFAPAVAALFWAANFFLAQRAVAALPALQVAALRFVIAAAVLLLWLRLSGSWPTGMSRRTLGRYAVLALTGIVGFNLLFFLGIGHTSPINGALIMATNPLLTVAIGAALGWSRVGARQALGLGVGFVGVAIILSKGSLAALLALDISGGDLLILGGVALWALYNQLVPRLPTGHAPLAATTITMTIGSAMMLPMAAAASPLPAVLPDLGVIAAITAMATFGTVLAYVAWSVGLSSLGPARAAQYVNLVPVFAMLISVGLGTPPAAVQLVGGGLVVLGLALGQSTRVAIPTAAMKPSAIHR